MFLGPVFSFELLTASRRLRYFIVRGLYGVVLAAALFIVWMSVFETTSFSQSQQVNEIALAANFMAGFFITFSVMQLLAAVVLGPAIAAGTIASERERRTIEYLFTANLSNAEIVFSKLAARLLQIMIILLTGMPILAIAMLQGGIAPEALLAVYTITFSTVVAVTALSIAVSVWSTRARDAVIRAYLVLLMLLIVPSVIMGLRVSAGINSFWFDAFLDYIIGPLVTGNPFYMLSAVVSGTSGAAMTTGWSAVGILVRNQMIFSAVCAIYAALSVRRIHVRQMGRSKTKRQWRILPRLRPAMGDRPMLWKELFAGAAASKLGALGRVAIYLLAACVVVPVAYEFFESLVRSYQGTGPDWQIRNYLATTSVASTFVGCAIGILAAARAACSVTSEKERDCWQSLLCTPLTGAEITGAKVLGSIYAFRYLFGVLILLWGLAAIISSKYIIAVPFMIYTFLIVMVSASSLGVIFSLRMKSSLWAMAATLGTCFFVGGGYLFCCVPFFIVSHAGDGVAISLAPCIPFLFAFPGMVCAHGNPGGEESVVAAYIIGAVGYSVTAGVLFTMASAGFDELVGRSASSLPWKQKIRAGHAPDDDEDGNLAGKLVDAQRRLSQNEPENVVEAEIVDDGNNSG